MVMLAIPNVSEGRDHDRVMRMSDDIIAGGSYLLDVHSDAAHNRSVFTLAGDHSALLRSILALGRDSAYIDLTEQRGVHPRLGGLDVCPFVPEGQMTMQEAIELAVEAASLLAGELDIPVYLYGEAATRSTTRNLPDIRRGGLAGLIARAAEGLTPDHGPPTIDPARGVICVGARSTLIAFNVWLACPVAEAAAIAAGARRHPGIRALGLGVGEGLSQVSMNLIDPERTSVESAFDLVAAAARTQGIDIVSTELVGLVPNRYLPHPQSEAARRSISPSRSLESVLRA